MLWFPEDPEDMEPVGLHCRLGVHPLDELYCTLQFIVTCPGKTTVPCTASVEQLGPESEIQQKHNNEISTFGYRAV